MLIADHNLIKMVDLEEAPSFHLDADSKHPNVVVEGNPFFSHYVAMARDGNILYFSDVNRYLVFEPSVIHVRT